MSNYEPRRLKRAVIKEEYIVITEDMMESVILNQMIYWSEKVRDFDQFIAENVKSHTNDAAENNSSESLLLHGWIYKSADQLKDEIMSQDSTRTINRKLDSLVSKGFLLRRRNPKDRYDHKYQYRVNFGAVLMALDAAGYALEGYAKFFPEQAQAGGAEGNEKKASDVPNGQSGRTNGQIVKTRGQNVGTDGQIGATKRQNVAPVRHDVATIAETIPEITPETIPEISSLSYSPAADQNTPATMENDPGELDSFFTGMGLEQLRHQEAVQWLKSLMADLWRTRRIGKEQIPVSTIRDAMGALTQEALDSLLDRIYQQREKGSISLPEQYMQRAILNEAHNAAFTLMAQQDGSQAAHAPTYDIQDYVDLSMKRLLEK